MNERIVKEEYQKKFPIWDAFRQKLVRLIEELTYDQTRIISVESRIKTWESSLEKMNKLDIEDLSFLSDIIGIRIIVEDLNEISILNNIISQNFQLHGIEEEKWDDTPLFGSIHMLVSLGEYRLQLVEYRHFEGMCAEIHIETTFYSAWQQVSHLLPNRLSINIPTPQKSSTGIALTDKFDIIIEEFEQLIKKEDISERSVHKFINENRFILHPNPKEIWSEVPIGLGTKYRMDFVIREANGSYILVEVENPNLKIINQRGDFPGKLIMQ